MAYTIRDIIIGTALSVILLITTSQACSSSQPPMVITDPTTLCTNALILSPEVQSQAKKLKLDTVDFARQICSAAILGVKIAETHFLPLETGGAPSVLVTSAGTAGTGE